MEISEREDKSFRSKEKSIRQNISNIIKEFDLKNKKKKVFVDLKDEINKYLIASDVIDVDRYEFYRDERIKIISTDSIQHQVEMESNIFEISNVSTNLKIFQLTTSPNGLYIIRNALPLCSQWSWADIALTSYSQASHTNLSNLALIKQSDDKITCNSDVIILKEKEISCKDLWNKSLSENNNFKSFKRLRWASLGYHYNWTLREYTENVKSDFPLKLSKLCQNLANKINQTMKPEAAIVNYYPIGSQMCGHLDDAEHCMTEPIVSISLGCDAIFLIGGEVNDICPVPILLRGGDVVVMSGESRRCYHGVPVVLPYTTNQIATKSVSEEAQVIDTGDGEGTNANRDYDISKVQYYDSDGELHTPAAAVIDYLAQGRININVRRVTAADGVWAWPDRGAS